MLDSPPRAPFGDVARHDAPAPMTLRAPIVARSTSAPAPIQTSRPITIGFAVLFLPAELGVERVKR